MKFLIVSALVLASSIAFADSQAVLPLYILCTQTTGQVNGVTAQHLFGFEKEQRSPHGFLLDGLYYRRATFRDGSEASKTGNNGKAVLLESEDDHEFRVEGVGYIPEGDSNLPTFLA